MRILICDDNPEITKQLHYYLCQYFEYHKLLLPEIVTYSSGDELLQDKSQKDIVLLDIEMPGVDGIYVGNTLTKHYPNVIILIITSFVEYLDDAMRFHVFRYLSKPIDKIRLYRNLTDALQLHSSREKKIAVETKDEVYTVSTKDIVYVEAQLRKVVVHTIHQDYVSTHNMQYWIEHLASPPFFQTHRSFIVNLAHVSNFDTTTVHLYNNHFSAYLTRRKYSEFKSNYLFYLESSR